ncbi:TetR/AcrR family transcriptional regulator [Granulicella sp. dw_53]|uniref:TetR/AcrR family transcriptional regulator n=1 Tax=Granulicella sp. dw_53 TaxID=2719792 RepID=UPI001BD3F4B6|nr:TetR/AcrR family transcriptional regulator [Granulicella sp. dw_53]
MTNTVSDPAITISTAGQRGPAEHERRHQILQAALEHFRHYGYKKTTVGDLAKAIGVSSAYIYKFFDSKQAIGETICTMGLAEIISELERIISETESPVECMRLIYKGTALKSNQVFLEHRKIHDIIAASFEENWNSHNHYGKAFLDIIRKVVLKGRETGEFERKSPLEEVCHAIRLTMEPFYHPLLLEQDRVRSEQDAIAVANLVLRSLAP